MSKLQFFNQELGVWPLQKEDRGQLYEAMLSSIEEFVYILDLDGRFIYANASLLASWNKSWGEALGKNFFELDYPLEVARRLQEQIQKVIQTGKPVQFETAYAAANGHEEFYEFHFSPFSSRGRIIAVTGATRLITGRKQRESELTNLTAQKEAQAHLFDATLSSINDLAYTFDLEGNWTYANKPLLELWGKSLDQIVGKSSLELDYPPELAERLKQQVKQVVATKKPFKGETFFTSGAGVVDYHEYIFSPVLAPDGSVVAVCGTTRLITERKRAEEQLRQRSERMQLLSETLSQLLSARDPETVVQELFPKVAAHLGADIYFNFMVNEQGDALRLHSFAGIDAEMVNKIQRLEFGQAICGTVAQLREPIVANDIQNSEYDKASLIRDFGIQTYACNPLLVGERLLGTLSFASRSRTAFDEDELKFIQIISQHTAIALDRMQSAKELRESNERLESRVVERTNKLQETIAELESFSYSISHDLRAPLRAMQSFALILEEECGQHIGPSGQDYLRRIVRSAERMDLLIQDILVFSKVARADLDLAPLNLNTLLRGILESYPEFDPANADFEVSDSLPDVLANDAALTQCFSNLMGNAVKFVANGVRPRIKIWAKENGSHARIFIQDNGIGIPEEAHERIFEIFEQLDKKFVGTGIGLAIVKKAAERMGGAVGVESTPGKGSLFWLDLKLAGSKK